MRITRRDFLRTSVSAGALTAVPWVHPVGRLSTPLVYEAPPITDATVRELAFRAVEAARAAGAAYADVRLTYTRTWWDGDSTKLRLDCVDIGVRALVGGAWGFAASALWSPDEVERLGQEAVHQARVNAAGQPLVVELGPSSVVKDGHWAHQVERDPFDVPEGEVEDYFESLKLYAKQKFGPLINVRVSVAFERQDKAFASTEGSYCTQRLYQTRGSFAVSYKVGGAPPYALQSPIIGGASRGWEYIRQAALREKIDRLVEEIKEHLALPIKPVEVGRYDIVFDAESLATVLDGTLGAATELDRALGYEANASGTSYLNEPLTMLGSYQAGASLVTVTGERHAPGGLATVRWDDDGLEPDQFTLVKAGVLVDFQTHREASGWLKNGYAKLGRGTPRSHGCAAASRAFDAPLIHPPNLTLAPGPDALDFAGLVGGLKKGLAVEQLELDVDFQCLNGFGGGPATRVYEVQDGKRVARIAGARFLLRAPEFWNGLVALGGVASRQPFARDRRKGEVEAMPIFIPHHTVTVVPGVAKQVTVIRAGEQ